MSDEHDPNPVYDAVRDLLWRAVQFGQTDDGDTRAYLLTKGTVHRLIGAMLSVGQPASFQAGTGVRSFEEYRARYFPAEVERERRAALTPEERSREDFRAAVDSVTASSPSVLLHDKEHSE